MSSDQQKWDQRYRDKPLILPTPPRFIEQSIKLMQPGTVLDLASGDGAASLCLAKAGFDVVAVDISAEALERLQQFAIMLGVSIRTVQVDLAADDWLAMLDEVVPGPINNIVITRYKPSLALWHQLATRLAPEGMMLLTSFNLKQHEQHGFNSRFCLQPAEFTGADPQLHLRYSASVQQDDDFMDEYLFEKGEPEASGTDIHGG